VNVRLGAVGYLNSKPLLDGLGPVALDVPSALARRFHSGEFDAALLPVFDVLRRGDARLVDGVSISCRGPARSVVVASRKPFSELDYIFSDPASISSSALLAVLLAEFYPDGPSLAAGGRSPGASDARLLIGDPALAFRRQHGASWFYFDLGAEWFARTGLPFVFAVWCLGSEADREVADMLRLARARGVVRIREIAAAAEAPEESLAYLTDNIRFGLAHQEKDAISRFAGLCLSHRLLSTPPALNWE